MFVAAMLLVISTVLYHQLTTLVDLYPLNNIREATRRERLTESLVNGPLMLMPAVLLGVAALLHRPPFAFAAAGLEWVTVAGGLALWWLPYLTGWRVPFSTVGTRESWKNLHARTYAQTIIIVPALHGRPRPNLEHMLLHALMLVAAVICLLYAFSM